jgi:hypothetical protein
MNRLTRNLAILASGLAVGGLGFGGGYKAGQNQERSYKATAQHERICAKKLVQLLAGQGESFPKACEEAYDNGVITFESAFITDEDLKNNIIALGYDERNNLAKAEAVTPQDERIGIIFVVGMWAVFSSGVAINKYFYQLSQDQS